MLTQEMINAKLLSLDTLGKFLQSDNCEAELISVAKEFLADAKAVVKYNQVANRNPFLMELDSVMINFNFRSGKVKFLLSPLNERNIGFYPVRQYDNYSLSRFTDGLFTMNLTNTNPVRRALEKQEISEEKAATLLAKRVKKFLFELLAKWNGKEYWNLIKYTVDLLQDSNPFRRRVMLPINLFSVTDFVHYFKNWQKTSLESDTIIDIKFDGYPFENELVKKLQKLPMIKLSSYFEATIADKFIDNPAKIIKLGATGISNLLKTLFNTGWTFKQIMELSCREGLTKKQSKQIQETITNACCDCQTYLFTGPDVLLTTYFNKGDYSNSFLVFDSDELKARCNELHLSESMQQSILNFAKVQKFKFADIKSVDDDKVFVTETENGDKIVYIASQMTVEEFLI